MDKNTNTISLETAQEWAKKWRDEEAGYNSHNDVHGFLIPIEDIQLLLRQNVDAIRAYIGVDEDNVEKLMLVGTKYNPDHDTYDDMLPGLKPEGRIYDFTKPCPPACAYDSPLNKLPKKDK